MRIALLHDWSVGYSGSERVLEQLIQLFPDADVFLVADFVPQPDRGFLARKLPTTSFIQHLPGARRWVRHYLPLMPLAVETWDLSPYDVVISSSHAVAKGALISPHQIHICYCHTPLRYGWDLQHQYLRESGLTSGLSKWLVLAGLHYLRMWDTRTAHGVDRFVANSRFVARRIRHAYGRESTVVAPPVDTDFFSLCEPKDSYYFCASRMVPYKRMLLLMDAFRATPERQLVLAGEGPCLDSMRKTAPSNVQLLGHVSRVELRNWMQRARAFLFAAEEDFGIVVAEAQACGTPAVCYARGGARDIVRDGQTGLFFDEQTVPDVLEALERFEQHGPWDARHISAFAQRFGIEAFRREFMKVFTDSVAHPSEEWIEAGRG